MTVVKKRRTGLMVFVAILAILVVCASASVYVVRSKYLTSIGPLDSTGQAMGKTFVVNLGENTSLIAERLASEGIIKNSWSFEWYARAHDLRDKFQAGTYTLSPAQSVAEIAEEITLGRVATDLFTIIPGQDLAGIKKRLIAAGFSPHSIDIALDPGQYKAHPALVDKPVNSDLEGYLYPDSYQKTASTVPEQIVEAALDQMAARLTPEIRAGFARSGLNVFEGITIASIVEKEENKALDRPKVAQVFLKRRAIGMQLGSDVTAFYGAEKAGRTNTQDVTFDTPYNTRIHNGLPPGPIGSVSASSLLAVANPATTDYLYFVAGDDGVTYFSKTLAEHEALAAAHCHKLCGR